LERRHGVRDVSYDHRVERRSHLVKCLADVDADKTQQIEPRIDHGHNRNAGLDSAQDGNFGKIRFAGEYELVEALRLCVLEYASTIALRHTKEREGVGQILDGETRLLGKSLRRQVIGVAPRWRALHLDQPLLDAPLEIGIDKTKRDPEIGSNTALRLRTIIQRVEQTENDPLFFGARARYRPIHHPSTNERLLSAFIA